MKKLDSIRRKIDRVDSQLLRLLNQRARLAVEIGRLKKSHGEVVYAPHREEMILRRLCRENKGPLPESTVRAVFREVMSGCRRLEDNLRVAYFKGTNSAVARLARVGFGAAARCMPFLSIAEVFQAVESSRAHVGVVPVENSDEGSVSDTLDLFIKSDLQIVGEWVGATTYSLCARVPLGKVTHVWGKENAVAAGREWLRRILPKATCRKADTLKEALQHASEDKGAALIVDIEDDVPAGLRLRTAAFHESQTRYWVLGRAPTAPTGHDKTSLMFILANEVGALSKAIQALSDSGINITRIESRPSHRKGNEFNFFVDISGHIHEPKVRKAVKKLESRAHLVKVIGAYPIVDGGREMTRA